MPMSKEQAETIRRRKKIAAYDSELGRSGINDRRRAYLAAHRRELATRPMPQGMSPTGNWLEGVGAIESAQTQAAGDKYESATEIQKANMALRERAAQRQEQNTSFNQNLQGKKFEFEQQKQKDKLAAEAAKKAQAAEETAKRDETVKSHLARLRELGRTDEAANLELRYFGRVPANVVEVPKQPTQKANPGGDIDAAMRAAKTKLDAISTRDELGATIPKAGYEAEYQSAIRRIVELSNQRDALVGASQQIGPTQTQAAKPAQTAATQAQPPTQAQTSSGGLRQVKTQEEWASLPSGTPYIDPNGKQRVKR